MLLPTKRCVPKQVARCKPVIHCQNGHSRYNNETPKHRASNGFSHVPPGPVVSIQIHPPHDVHAAENNFPAVEDVQHVSVLEEPATETAVEPNVTLKDIPYDKASVYLLRTDGNSCSRELVTATGKLQFAYPSTQQHMLVWRQRPTSVMVLKKLGTELLDELEAIVRFLAVEEDMRVVVEPDVWESHFKGRTAHWTKQVMTYAEDEEVRLSEYVDFVVCLGGDGVLLHASYLFRSSIPPVLSFSLGSLGFLTNHKFKEFRKAVREIIYGSRRLDTCSMDDLGDDGLARLGFFITLRMRLQCEIRRRGSLAPEQVHEVLNEVVIDRGSSSFLTNLECYEKGRFITRVQADGVIVATPTGSTAYSVAAGGSMVHPNVPCILVTPICPHSLNFRPVIMPDYAEIELRVPDNARATAWVCFDGKLRQELARGDSVLVRMSSNPMPTINKNDLTGDWFDSLERCFSWSHRREQQAL